jgi:hypothetical protein
MFSRRGSLARRAVPRNRLTRKRFATDGKKTVAIPFNLVDYSGARHF